MIGLQSEFPCVNRRRSLRMAFVVAAVLGHGSVGVAQRGNDFFAPGNLVVSRSVYDNVPTTKDQMVTSFPSKSELALNLSTDGSYLTFMGYVAPVGAADISNSNTPAIIDPTNPVVLETYRQSRTSTSTENFISRS
jgi:hypothetical protein